MKRLIREILPRKIVIRVAEEKIIIELTSLKVPMYFKAHYIVPWSSLCLKVDILRIWSIEKREWPCYLICEIFDITTKVILFFGPFLHIYLLQSKVFSVCRIGTWSIKPDLYVN